MQKSIAVAITVSASFVFSTHGLSAQEVFSPNEALSEDFPDTLFVVKEPFESRRTIDLERSGGLVLAEDTCLDDSYVSRSRKIWFSYNNRGPVGGRRDALSVLIAKWNNKPATRKRQDFTAFRNSNPWYRGRVKTYFAPDSRPLRSMTLDHWNSGHMSEQTAQYDRLFGRKPGDRFHASPVPEGVSSSNDSAWWALPEFDSLDYSELVVDARLLRFSRASYEQPEASGVSFYLSPGRYQEVLLKTRSDDQSLTTTSQFTLGNC